MSDRMSPAQRAVGDVVPALAELTDEILFGNVWKRPGLTARDRSMITVAALVALGRTEQLEAHMPLALDNGVTEDELTELVTHLAFYGGWPVAFSAAAVLRRTRKSIGPTD